MKTQHTLALLLAALALATAAADVPAPPKEEAVILTPVPPAKPRINGAKVFGVRPGHPVLYTIAATGQRPMTFGAKNLPAGLQFDEKTGRFSGAVTAPGEYKIALSAKNASGENTAELRLVVGDQIALTPPMGWNSWNVFAGAVSAEKIKRAADLMVSSGLVDHGWNYINIDDFWQVKASSKDATLHGPDRDAAGNIVPNPRFPDMPALAAYVHGRGLRFGLYSSPGPTTCGGCTGSFEHEAQDAQSYAAWGVDYLKYDWCSYQNKTNDLAGLQAPYKLMGDLLRQQSRDIVFSLCQYGMGHVSEWGGSVHGNSWRTTGDIGDSWKSLSEIGFGQNDLAQYAKPGNWNDPDMLVVGWVGWGNPHPPHLTPNEQYTHISLWCLLSAPLLLGCDLSKLDPFTLNLLTNDEVLAVNQDPLGKQATRVAQIGTTEVWAKDLEWDPEMPMKAVGLFNRGETEATVTVTWRELGVSALQNVRDLWRQKDLGLFADKFEAKVPPHGVVLVRCSWALRQ